MEFSKLEGPILLVVSHPDDEVLGFGASADKLSRLGIEIYTLIICGGAEKRYNGDDKDTLIKKCTKACKFLGMKETFFGSFPNLVLHNIDSYKIVGFIEKYIKEIKPRTVVTHHPGDLNIDHTVVSNACLTACRLGQRRPDLKLPSINNIWFMEILSSTDWAYSNGKNIFSPNCFLGVSEENLNCKIDALNIYENVMRQRPHPRNKETVESLAILRGSQCGSSFAESFQLSFKYYAF